ncbi:amidohydrolase family protein [Wukongibacter sp. M2B1]|uniref:amidohydrolase family protein n=1 Tax=Wukongibacter sp. M2B1 TaxID=3088895 RepID=UPI003D795DFA
MIIDSHTHITDKNSDLFKELETSNIDGINIICVSGLFEEENVIPMVNENRTKDKQIYLTSSISLDDFQINKAFENFDRFNFIKIHPRVQSLVYEDIRKILIDLRSKHILKPIIIDMFPYRTDRFRINYNRPINYEELLIEFNDYNFVFAHFGGIYLREVFMMLKCYKNLYADTSLITRYFKDSPIDDELYYFIKRLEGEKVLYGSDYPEMKLQESLDLQLKKMQSIGMKSNHIERVLGKNFLDLLSC